jgi:hypothetical protein
MLLIVVAAPVSAQDIRFDPRPDWPAERQFDAFLEAGGYVLLEADTVLGPEDGVDGNLLVLEADVRIEGQVTGDVVAVGGDLFLRPGARVGGSVLVLGGGFYASRRAEIAGELTYRPNDIYAVRRGETEIRIHPVREIPETLTLHGLSGITFPTYQRVDAWTLGLGATVRNIDWGWQPSLEARVRLKTDRGRLEGTLRQAWYPTGSLTFGAEAERATRTNEGWVRGDVANTLSFFFAGDDFRNYYEADRVAVFLRGTETARWGPILEVEWEKARSLAASDRFVLFAEDAADTNPSIDDGEVLTAKLGARFRRRTAATSMIASASVEVADDAVGGDFTYAIGELTADWVGPGLAAHEVEAFLLVRGDLSGSPPRQRWAAVGGRATLPTVPLLAERGSRLVFGQFAYLVPIERLRVGVLGAPRWFLRIAAGAGWNDGAEAGFETNLISGLRLSVFELAVAVDPGESDLDAVVYGILRFPGDL